MQAYYRSNYYLSDVVKRRLPYMQYYEMSLEVLFSLYYSHYESDVKVEIAKELIRRGWMYLDQTKEWILVSKELKRMLTRTFIELGEFVYFDKMLFKILKKFGILTVYDVATVGELDFYDKHRWVEARINIAIADRIDRLLLLKKAKLFERKCS
uniref:NOT2_3_5 domain-containing protein n=1 Tax=Rhabditophanes sp. KR3021 TaxID=114890 RepID=A0AC35TNW9_9BILA